MNIAIWMLAGGLIGWLSFAYLGLNEGRGMTVSVVIGLVGGFLGGNVVAPMFVQATAVPGDFSAATLCVAMVVAAAFLAIGSQLYDRWGL